MHGFIRDAGYTDRGIGVDPFFLVTVVQVRLQNRNANDPTGMFRTGINIIRAKGPSALYNGVCKRAILDDSPVAQC